MIDMQFEFMHDTLNNTTMKSNYIELWIEQTGKKKKTYISGFDDDLILKSYVQEIKQNCGCNGTIKKMSINDKPLKVIGILFGNHLDYVKEFLINKGISSSDINIKGIVSQ